MGTVGILQSPRVRVKKMMLEVRSIERGHGHGGAGPGAGEISSSAASSISQYL